MAIFRASGILLHPTSLPGRFGIGDLGQAAYRFVDFLGDSGQQIWQILPLGPTGYGNSPYMCYSALAGNPLLIDLDALREEGLLEESELDPGRPTEGDRVDFDAVIPYKMALLHRAYGRFKDGANPDLAQEFEQFCEAQQSWLEDYALFIAVKRTTDDAPWYDWEPALAKREPEALAAWRDRLGDEVGFSKYVQFEFFRQWQALKAYANDRSIAIFGDIPIYVAGDSADVWANPDLFCLNPETGKAALMAGVPPDYFSETGQLWGNPVYDWDALAATGYRWWIERFRHTLTVVDWIRVDHFRGFEGYWAVPEGETTAIAGEWLPGPGAALFEAVDQALGQLPIIAEDLGIITPEVEALRDRFGFPGMKILHFAFDSGAGNPYLPHNFGSPNYLIYTGTHDNDTTVGWFRQRSPEDQERVYNYLGYGNPDSIHWDLIRAAHASVAVWSIIPLQDLFGLGTECRFNTPGLATGNWDWRYGPDDCTDAIAQRLRWLTELYGRAPQS